MGVTLLREENLDLEKAEGLVKLQETATMMIQGRTSNMRVSAVDATEGCQNCGKKGHDSKDERGNVRKFAETKKNTAQCYFCGRPGHFARECRNNNRSGQGTQGGCYSCGQKGHWARDCPRQNRQGRENFSKNRIRRTTPPGGGGEANMAWGQRESKEIGRNADKEGGRSTGAIPKRSPPFSRGSQPKRQDYLNGEGQNPTAGIVAGNF
ncbi:DNA-binding protein HEXBP-like [Coccinella septempunctata]|uniref:DNA-binding protein HEXBP-like n=1 Tax=Coccinella septempunctata TaxID=41139 RepID=UPI001D075F96|nr:DNA-binding protein HEXBP-like [Coccinella septempunctata]